MIVNYYSQIGNIDFYSNPLQELNVCLKGRRQDADGYFIIAHPNTIQMIYNTILIQSRINKIRKIKSIIMKKLLKTYLIETQDLDECVIYDYHIDGMICHVDYCKDEDDEDEENKEHTTINVWNMLTFFK